MKDDHLGIIRLLRNNDSTFDICYLFDGKVECRNWKLNSEHKFYPIGRTLDKLTKNGNREYEMKFSYPYDYSQPDFLVDRLKKYESYLDSVYQDNIWTYEESTDNWDFLTEREKFNFICSQEAKSISEWEKTDKYK